MTKKGVTIIEFLVAIAIFVIIGGILTSIFISGWRAFDRESAQTNTQSQAKFVTSTITRETQQATAVVPTRTFGGQVYNSSSSTLILELISFDANKNLIDGAFDYGVFYLDPDDNKKLKLTIEANPLSNRRSETKTISLLIESIAFSYYFSDGSAIQNNQCVCPSGEPPLPCSCVTAVVSVDGDLLLPIDELDGTQRVNVTVTTAQDSYGKTQRTTLTGSAKIRNK